MKDSKKEEEESDKFQENVDGTEKVFGKRIYIILGFFYQRIDKRNDMSCTTNFKKKDISNILEENRNGDILMKKKI